MIEKLEKPYIELVGMPAHSEIHHPTPPELVKKINELIDVVNRQGEVISITLKALTLRELMDDDQRVRLLELLNPHDNERPQKS